MTPILLTLENFQGHSKSELDFTNFKSALIIGKQKNNDFESNGVGKSTIFNAIEYVLFNKVSAKQLDKVIRDGADFCKVQFIFSLNDEEFKIERARSKKSSTSDLRLFKKNSINSWEDKTQRRIPDTEKEIEKLLKINYEAFKNSILFSHRADRTDSDLASITAEKRKNLLKETLQLNNYSKYEKLAKNKLSLLQKELDKNKNILSSIPNSKQEIEDLNKVNEELALNKDKILQDFNIQKINLDILDKKYLEKISSFNELEKEINNYSSNKLKLEFQLSKNEVSLNDLNKKLQTLKNEANDLLSNLNANKIKLNEVCSKQFRDIKDLNIEFNKNNQDLVDFNSTIKSLQIKNEELKIPLPNTSVCSHCRQILTEDHRKSCQEEINNQILENDKKISEFAKNVSNLRLLQQNLQKELSEINQQEKLIINYKNLIEVSSKEIYNKKSVFNEFSEILKKEKELYSSKKEELNILSSKVNNLEEYSKKSEEIKSIKKSISEIKSNLDLLNEKTSTIYSSINICNHKIQQCNKNLLKIEELSANIQNLEHEATILQTVIQAFGSSGIPSLIIHNILDDLQFETNSWLSQIKPGIQLNFLISKENKTSGEQEDTLDINYIVHGKERDYDLISSGQKLAISLSLRLGIMSILKKQIGIDIKMLLLDEVDQPLDDNASESLSDIVKQLQNDFKILVITHRNSLKDKFSNVICVEQDETFASTINPQIQS